MYSRLLTGPIWQSSKQRRRTCRGKVLLDQSLPFVYNIVCSRWHGSVGRAHRSHRWGRWFESNCHHQQRRSLRNQASLLFLSLPHGGTKKNETPGTNFDVNGMTGSLRAHRSMCTVWRLDVYELPELMCTECWHGCERNELWVCTAW